MYEAYFGLERRPFAASPDADCFAAVGMAEAALADLLLCVQAGRGVAVLSAAAGTGKTLLCRRLVRELGDDWAAAMLTHAGFPTRRSLLQAILYELGRPYARMADQELRLELQTAAREVRADRQGVVVLVDEAHLLSERLLEEVRSLANHAEDGEPLFRFVLSGQLSLEETLAAPSLEAFRQRIGCQATLETLSQADSIAYLSHCAEWAGAPLGELFAPDAVRLICHASDGLPRCLNQLSDHSLLLGCVTETHPVTEEVVRQALDDLRQLPLHWNAPTRIPTPLEQLQAQRPARSSVVSEAPPESEPALPVEVFESEACAAFEVGGECAAEWEPAAEAVAAMPAIEFGAGAEHAAIPAAADLGRPHPPQLIDETISDPWSGSVCGREVFEARPGDETPAFFAPAHVASPAKEPHRPSPQPGADGEGKEASSSPDRAASPPDSAASSESTPSVSIPRRPERGRDARTKQPHFSAPPAPRTPKPRPAAPPRAPRAESAEEEQVFDRYAMLDAGQVPSEKVSLPPAAPPATPLSAESESWTDFEGHLPNLPPDERIDRIVPMLDEALSLGEVSGGVSRPAAASPPAPRDGGRGNAAPRVPALSLVGAEDDLEDLIGQAVLDSCLDAQEALGARTGQRSSADAASADEEPEAAGYVSYETSDETGPETPPPPQDAPRQYSQLFSALRKKFRRGA